jgi:hypothetical protein
MPQYLIERHIPGAGDKIYCVYNAPSEEAIREHAKRGPFPANLIVPISEVISPATGK